MSQYSLYPPKTGGGGAGTWKTPVATAAALPVVGNVIGDARAAADTGVIYVWTGVSWDTAVAGVGTVTSVGLSAPGSIFSVSGSPVTGAGTLALALTTQAAGTFLSGPVSGGPSAPTFRALTGADLAVGTPNTVAGFGGGGELESIPNWGVNTVSGGLDQQLTEQPNDFNTGYNVNNLQVNFDPLKNSPNDSWTLSNVYANFDVNSSGFTLGTNTNAAILRNNYLQHLGTGSVGGLIFNRNSANLGNGVDPISVRGLFYSAGFGNVNSGVTMTQALQGYNLQVRFNPGSVMQGNVLAYGDFCNFEVAVPGYQSFVAAPQIAEISNNSNYLGVNIAPTITTFTGNAGFTGVNISPQLGTLDTGSFQGITVNPTIALNKTQALGLNVTMAGVTNYVGVKSSLVVQDLTYQFNAFQDNDYYTLEYANDGVAGAETFTVGGSSIVGHIQSGVSTATQIRAAAILNVNIFGAITVTISGTGSTAQVTAAPVNFTGGEDPGTAKAAQFEGDVQINGALSFTGALSIGALTSFAPYTVMSGTGFTSIDSLITQPNVPANAVITGTDLLAINTAMLLNIGDNASVTSNFLGFAALGMPTVLSMGIGSTIDLVAGAIFAVSLDGSATGGIADRLELCRTLAIPNGVTVVNNLVGYQFDLPFGDPGTFTWGFYSSPVTAHNFLAGDLKVGGVDLPSNSSVGIELESTTKAVRFSNMTTTQKLALTALPGMQVFDTTLTQMSYYNGTTWINF